MDGNSELLVDVALLGEDHIPAHANANAKYAG
jgi:hypothetical protein